MKQINNIIYHKWCVPANKMNSKINSKIFKLYFMYLDSFRGPDSELIKNIGENEINYPAIIYNIKIRIK